MARIGRKGRLWLRAFHIFFMTIYIGGIISELVIIASMGSARSDGGLQAMYQIIGRLPIAIAPAMTLTIITGLLLAWLTPWGFKHKWVVYTIAIAVLITLVNFTLSQPLLSRLAALVEAGGLLALQNPEYMSTWNMVIILDMVKLLLYVSAAFVSVIKPWRRREGAEATP
jgi:uncharacterized membrane protein